MRGLIYISNLTAVSATPTLVTKAFLEACRSRRSDISPSFRGARRFRAICSRGWRISSTAAQSTWDERFLKRWPARQDRRSARPGHNLSRRYPRRMALERLRAAYYFDAFGAFTHTLTCPAGTAQIASPRPLILKHIFGLDSTFVSVYLTARCQFRCQLFQRFVHSPNPLSLTCKIARRRSVQLCDESLQARQPFGEVSAASAQRVQSNFRSDDGAVKRLLV